MNRNLSGIYFRVERDGDWQNICFEDMTEKEQDKTLKGKNPEFIYNLAKSLGKTIKGLGDAFEISNE